MLASTKPKGGNPMRTISRIHRQRRWLAAGVLAGTARNGRRAGDGRRSGARQDRRVPDHADRVLGPGLHQARSRRRRRTKDLAVAVDAVAQSASHSLFSINFVWTLVAGFLVMFMQAGFALVETGLIRAKNAAHTMSMNFMVYALGMFGFFVCGFAFMCGGLNGTAIGGPATLGGVPTLHSHVHRRLGRQRRPRLGPLRHHRLLPHRQRLRRRRHRAVPVHDGLHGHDGDHRHRRVRRALELQELLHLQHLHRRASSTRSSAAGCGAAAGWRSSATARASATARSTTPAPASSTCRAARWRSSPRILIGPRIGKYDKDGKVNADPAAPHPDGAARHVHPRLRLVRLQRRQLAGGHRRPHRHRRDQHHARRHVGDRQRRSSTCGWSTASPIPSMMCNSMLAGLVAITVAVRVRHAGRRVHHRRRRRRAGHLERLLLRQASRSTIRSAPSASTASTALWGLIAVGLFSDGTYGQGWNGVGATDYLGVAGRGVTGLFYGDSKQLVAQLIEVGRLHRLERRRRRRRLLRSSARSSGQPRVGRGRDRRPRHSGDGRPGLPGVHHSRRRRGPGRRGRRRRPCTDGASDEGRITERQRIDGRASRSNRSRPGIAT